MNSEMVLGLDGFSMAFFQVCFDVIKADIMGVFQGIHYGVFNDFHASSKFENCLNVTFIA